MKLVVEEPESRALAEHVAQRGLRLASSRIAMVEVARAVRVANPSVEGQSNVRRLLEATVLVDVGAMVLRAAAALTSERLRTLDAIHLATIELVDPADVLVYDEILRDAAGELGYAVAAPGSTR